MKRLSLDCPPIRLLDIQKIKGAQEVAVKKRNECGDLLVVKGEGKVVVDVMN